MPCAKCGDSTALALLDYANRCPHCSKAASAKQIRDWLDGKGGR